MRVLNWWVDIEDGSGAKIGSGPLRARNARCSRPLSKSGDFSFEVMGSDPNISALAAKRVAFIRYIDEDGDIKDFGGGVIDQINLVIDSSGLAVFVVSGNDITRELNYRSVGSLALASGSAGVADGPEQIMALAPAGWSISFGTTLTDVYVGFDGESVLSALCKVGEHIGEHWYWVGGREIGWLGPVNNFFPSGVRAVQHVNDPVGFEEQSEIVVILGIEEMSDAADLLSRVIPRGSGNGGVMTTLAAATDAAPAGYTLSTANNYLKNNAAENAYGRIERVLDIKNFGPLSNTTADIQSASNALLQAAYQHLERYSTPFKAYRIELWANSMLLPGTTLRVVYRSLAEGTVAWDLDDELVILSVEHALDETGLHTSQVEVSTIDRHPLSDTDVMISQARGGTAYAAHQQLSASVDTLTWRDEMDNSNSSSFRFWLGDEYTQISQAVFRFKIQPLRSTVKSVAGASTTTASGGGHTSGSGGGETAVGGSHQHWIDIYNDTFTYDLGIRTSAGLAGLYASGGGAQLEVGTSASHDHTISAHTHSVSNHTHTLTPEINTVYGIFEESGANTLVIGNLVLKLNGGADLAGSVVSLGNGWYGLDISDDLVDSVFRPAQENNELVISTATAKTARIEAQLTIRGVVQAVAYT